MKIALVSPTFPPQTGGAETYAGNLASALSAAGHTVDVISSALQGPPLISDDGVRVHRIGPDRSDGSSLHARWFAGFSREAVRTLASIRPEAVFAQYSALLPAARYERQADVPLIAIAHTLYGLRDNVRLRGPLTGLAKFLANERLLVIARPGAVIVPSEAVAAKVRRVLDSPVSVAHPGADHVPLGPVPPSSSLEVLFCGRLVPSKRVADAVAAMTAVRARIPGAGLHVVGGGPDAALLPSWVRASGVLRAHALDRAARGCALLVFPSIRESWGLVVTECAARGLAYVAYDIPAIAEQHEILQGGVLVASGDVGALTRAIEALLRDPVRRAALGARGQGNARSLLRWERTAAVAMDAVAIARDGAPAAATAVPHHV